jgi:hypothetical protein
MTADRKALEAVGQMLAQDVRDRTIEDWDKLIDGTMKGERAAKVKKLLASFKPDQIEAVKRLFPAVIDTTLHHLLFALEQQELKKGTRVSLSVAVDGASVPDVSKVSDGLAGELYGWIPKFSKQRRDTTD